MAQRVVLFLLILNCFINIFCGTIRKFKSQQVITMNDKILPNHILRITNTSMLGCAVDCVSEPSCEWVSYKQDDRTCRCHSIHLELADTGTQAIIANGWRSFRLIESWCPYQRGFIFSQSLDLCYKLIPGRVLCAVAVQMCVLESARPLIIDSAEEQDFITTILENRSDMNSTWLDAVLSAGQWFWYDGERISNTYSYWDTANSQPQNLPGCLAFARYNSYRWHDYELFYKFDTICEVRRVN